MKMSFHKLVSTHKRKISCVLLTVMVSELLLPLHALALTSGPSQPEFQGFTPLATTSLVDPFSGDFSYNIPLLEVDGYPLNLVYRATSNIEEEASWVGYGWNVNVGTLNRLVRGLPDDMNGGEIKSYQNIRERTNKSLGVSFEPSFGVHVGEDNVGISAGVRSELGFTFDDDNYIGEGIGVSVGGGVYASANAGPFSVTASAGVTLSAHSNLGGTISYYAGFNAGLSYGEYFSVGFGKSVSRSYNTINGWERPNIVGSLNISNVTFEVQKNFISSISNDVPVVTNPYKYYSDGVGFRLDAGFSFGLIEELGIDFGVGVAVVHNKTSTTYQPKNIHKGYGYMYSENASNTDMLDFTRDNDGAINREMPFVPPAMKTYDVFSSTAHNGSNVFRADRNDFGTVRDPFVQFPNTDGRNEMHQLEIHGYMSLSCWIGISIKYDNVRTRTEGTVASGGCVDDLIPYRKSKGKDQNLFFKPCGATSQADDNYLAQVNKYGFYALNKADSVRGITKVKRPVVAEPIAVYTNKTIADLPQTVIPKQLPSYKMNHFPINPDSIKYFSRGYLGDNTEASKIGAIINTNKAGQAYVYATPVQNNIKNEVAFRVNGFDPDKYQERDGLMSFVNSDASQFNGQVRDYLYKNTLTPSYATSYMLNAVLSPDYVDVTNNGISDDDLGSFVKFNYSKSEDDYRWRVPYGDSGQNIALLNRGVKTTKFDDMGSYMIGSKQLWYAHSIESKNYVVEFYLSKREDALDSRSKIMRGDHPYAVNGFTNDKDSFAHMQKLDSIKYYYKHDRYLNKNAAVPLKTIYFDYDYGISSNMPNSANNGGKLRLLKLRVRHGDEPVEFAETYNLSYSSFNPAYKMGDKDGWGNYYPNNRPLPLCEFPYIDQVNTQNKDVIASAFHLTSVGLPSGGKVDVEYEADDYAWVQNKRAMALTEVAGVGPSPNAILTDVQGLYDNRLDPYSYIYVAKPAGLSGGAVSKSFLLNGSDLMYFSFHIKIAGSNFPTYDQVKGYAVVEDVGVCPNDGNYIYIKVKPVDLTGTNVDPSPMTNTAINMARTFATDQLYFQEDEDPSGHNQGKFERLKKAAIQVADAILGHNSIKDLMKRYRAGHRFIKNKSYVRIALAKPKIGGGSRVAKLTFDDEWNQMTSGESSSLIGYRYIYKDENGLSSGVASYEPLVGGEENPFRTGTSYALTNNSSRYPPYDPIELIKEDPAGESFFPTGSVGYSRVVIESIHKGYARSAQSRLVHEFYTARDFPYISSYDPLKVIPDEDKDYPTPGIRDILLSFLGISNTHSSSRNSYDMKQNFVIETNDMHGKPKGTYNYRLLFKNGKEELVSATEYFYHTNGHNRLSNDVSVLQYEASKETWCRDFQNNFPQANLKVATKTLGVDVDVCTDSREVISTEIRNFKKRGGGFKFCIPISVKPKFNWIENTHTHVDYFKLTATTKVVNRYGILKTVRNYKEGAETIIDNKYYDPITGSAVVQVSRDKYGDPIHSTNIPAYWTKTDLEPAYMDFPYRDTGSNMALPSQLQFSNAPNAGLLSGTGLVYASFNTGEDVFHRGDELFVQATSNFNSSPQWYRLYVADILVRKNHSYEPDPLSHRYGNGQSTGAVFQVFLTPYKVGGSLGSSDIQNQSTLNVQSYFKYRSGRKNMLDLSAGNFLTLGDPFVITDSVNFPYRENYCKVPSLMKPNINATASRYEDTNSYPNGSLAGNVYNPVSTGNINQPYVTATYALFGDRKDLSGTMQQRQNGILNNWYYWLQSRYDSNSNYVRNSPLLKHYDNSAFNAVANATGNAVWFTASNVTKSIPSLGPVEETNPLGIFGSIYIDPTTKRVSHATANGKFGQTWVETFEDLQQLKKYNSITDLIFSPFQKYMKTSNTLVNYYDVFTKAQSLTASTSPNMTGSFTLDNTQSHTGVFSLNVTSPLVIKVLPKKFTGSTGYYFSLFDFNLDNTSNQKFTYEVWVKTNGSAITAPSVTSGSTTTTLTKVSTSIDGWVLYRTNINVSDNSQVTFTFPSGQSYDDMRVFPSSSNVKTYVYHPFRTYLMAVLDENNYATFYEYNSRNQLVRLKKETEKGIITITENIKNTIRK